MSLFNEETRRKLRELNLNEMIEAIDHQTQDISYSTMSFEDRMKMAIAIRKSTTAKWIV